MEKERDTGLGHPHPRRAWRSVREIVVAVLLTIAALAFITTAMLRSSKAPGSTPAYETARQPQPQ